MKVLNVVIVFVFAMFSANALAYLSGAADPQNSVVDIEYRHVVKSETAGVSDAISKGDVLSLDVANNNDGGTVTRVGANDTVGSSKNVCVAAKAIATGDTGNVRCVTRGYVDYLKYDASTAIEIGSRLCGSADGEAVVCAACVPTIDGNGDNDCKFGNATQNSGIVSLEAKASGTGSDLKAYIRFK